MNDTTWTTFRLHQAALAERSRDQEILRLRAQNGPEPEPGRHGLARLLPLLAGLAL